MSTTINVKYIGCHIFNITILHYVKYNSFKTVKNVSTVIVMYFVCSFRNAHNLFSYF